jgi:hypothetical protein
MAMRMDACVGTASQLDKTAASVADAAPVQELLALVRAQAKAAVQIALCAQMVRKVPVRMVLARGAQAGNESPPEFRGAACPMRI